jgi:ferric iron reductase protein FhuF
LQAQIQSQVFFATHITPGLQSRTPNSCNRTLVQFFFFFFAVTEINQQILQSNTLVFLQSLNTQVCNHIPKNQVALQAHKVRFLFFATAHNSWLQSRTPNSCNHKLAQFSFSFFCSHRNKPAIFAMTHFSFLQSLTTQACNHIPNNQISFFNHTDKVRFFFATAHFSWLQSRTPNCCNRTLVQFFFLFFAVTEINQKILQSNTLVFCNHKLPMIAIIFQTTK